MNIQAGSSVELTDVDPVLIQEIETTDHPGPSDKRASSRAIQNSNDLANLDLLRALAVSLVLFGHLLGTMKIRGLGELGHFGVLLFLFTLRSS